MKIKMKIYIASPYVRHAKINKDIYNALINIGYSVFLPESIGLDALTIREQFIVSEKCFYEIDKSDIIVAVYPFGLSVSCELGYAINYIKHQDHKRIILFNTDKKNEIINTEAMIMPFINREVYNIQELIDCIDTLK